MRYERRKPFLSVHVGLIRPDVAILAAGQPLFRLRPRVIGPSPWIAVKFGVHEYAAMVSGFSRRRSAASPKETGDESATSSGSETGEDRRAGFPENYKPPYVATVFSRDAPPPVSSSSTVQLLLTPR